MPFKNFLNTEVFLLSPLRFFCSSLNHFCLILVEQDYSAEGKRSQRPHILTWLRVYTENKEGQQLLLLRDNLLKEKKKKKPYKELSISILLFGKRGQETPSFRSYLWERRFCAQLINNTWFQNKLNIGLFSASLNILSLFADVSIHFSPFTFTCNSMSSADVNLSPSFVPSDCTKLLLLFSCHTFKSLWFTGCLSYTLLGYSFPMKYLHNLTEHGNNHGSIFPGFSDSLLEIIM